MHKLKLSTLIIIIFVFLIDFGVFDRVFEKDKLQPEYMDLIYISTDCTEFNEWSDAWCICKEHGEVWIDESGYAMEPMEEKE